MVRIFTFLALFATLLGLSPLAIPLARQGVRLVAARDDPAAIADLGLATFSAEDARRAMEEALAQDDAALAQSFLELADARGLPVPAELRARVQAANAAAAQALRSAREFGLGFLTGEPHDLAGLAGAATGDLMVWGDIRDAGREGLKIARGEPPDELILGLSAVGIAITAGTYATVGASLPVRIGISLVKVAKRTGRLSAALARSLGRAVRESVDLAALRRLASGSGAVDGAALKGIVRTDRLAGLTRMLDDAASIQAKAGTRAALEGLKVADGGRDLARVARLAEVKGGQTLAILKTLGRGAIVITSALLHLVWWVFLAVAYTYGLVSSFNAFCVACARRTWRRPRRRPAPRRPLKRAMPRSRGWRIWWRRAPGAPASAAPRVRLPLPPEPAGRGPAAPLPAGPEAAERFARAAEDIRRLTAGPAVPPGAAPGDGALERFAAAADGIRRLAREPEAPGAAPAAADTEAAPGPAAGLAGR